MRVFIEEYGRLIVAVLVAAGMGMWVISCFINLWQEYGGVPDGAKTNFYANEEKRGAPSLKIQDFKIRTGETLCFLKYIQAADYDGSDLSSRLEASEKDKFYSVSSGYWKERHLPPGMYPVDVRIQSPVTGKETKGTVLVLVDA